MADATFSFVRFISCVLRINISRFQSILLDEIAAWFDDIAHQSRENIVGFDGVVNFDLQQRADFRIESGFPKLFRVHLTETFISLDLQAFEKIAGDALQLTWQVSVACEGHDKPVCVAETIARRFA